MKGVVASVVGLAGLCLEAAGVVNTSVVWQISTDGVHWSSQTPATTGQRVMARAMVSYIGTGAPLGLASLVFQPTVSNTHAGDTVLPFINSGVGGNTSAPPGVIDGGRMKDRISFGRLSPWGAVATTSSSAIRGFFHTNPNGDNVDYLRIAQAQNTSWIGGSGNTTGARGVNIAQLSNVGRTSGDPAFNGSLSNICVFKFGITLGPGIGNNIVFDSPVAGFGNRNSSTGDREVYWWGDMNEATGSIRGTAIVTPATIHLPAPASLALLGLGGLCVGRRRGRERGERLLRRLP